MTTPNLTSEEKAKRIAELFGVKPDSDMSCPHCGVFRPEIKTRPCHSCEHPPCEPMITYPAITTDWLLQVAREHGLFVELKYSRYGAYAEVANYETDDEPLQQVFECETTPVDALTAALLAFKSANSGEGK